MAGWWGGNDIASVAGGSELDSRAGQIRHKVANGLPPLRCFFGVRSCVAQVLNCGDTVGSATRHMLGRDTASIMKV